MRWPGVHGDPAGLLRRWLGRSVRRGTARVTGAVAAGRDLITRLTVSAVGVRVAVFGSGLAALLLAYPASRSNGWSTGLFCLVAMAAAVVPGGRAPAMVMALVVGCWLVRSNSSGTPGTFWRVLAVAGLLYLVHTTVQRGALGGWLRRAVTVVVLGSGLSCLVVLALMTRNTRVGQGAAYLGVGAVVGVVVLLAAIGRRAGPTAASADHGLLAPPRELDPAGDIHPKP